MRPKYTTRAIYIAYDEDGDLSMTADEVYEDDDGPTFTGLYDATGQRLYRETQKHPIGFDLRSRHRTSS